MKISEKILMNREELEEHGPITIVAFGDSVTHGALGDGEISYETVYWNLLKQKINNIRNYIPVNVINAGVGGCAASGSIKRMESQVLSHNPDLIIVCFGLNDINLPLEEYLSALKTIFEKCYNSGAQTIFMTPNMLNTYVAEGTHPDNLEYAKITAEYQNSGKMDTYMSEAVKLAQKMDVTVCDCYSKWKELSKTEDTTMMLINRINHPSKEMHELFAQSLFDIIFEKDIETINSDSTMFNG